MVRTGRFTKRNYIGIISTGSIEQDTSSQQKCVFDLDVKDISVEAIHPSRYSATAVATFTGRSATSDDSTAGNCNGGKL